jgi:hypothetical protein
MHSMLELTDILLDGVSSNAAVHLHVHVVAQSHGHLLRLLSQLTGG